MKPEAFLPSNSPWPNSASVVPATPPANAGPVVGTRQLAPKAILSAAQYYESLGRFLRDNRNAPRKVRLELIKWRQEYELYQEAAEFKADPTAEEDLRRIAERLAHKAQSGFAGSDNDPSTT